MDSNAFAQFLSNLSKSSLYILDKSISKSAYIALDLSVENEALKTVDILSSEKLGNYIDVYIKANKAKVAFGGYLEKRGIYRRSNHFNNDYTIERTIHLGLDLWIAAETPIYAPLAGEVHSYKNNTNFGDYGPTIILKHIVQNVEFYTLYGHLSIASIQHLEVGQSFKQGARIATLGDASVNGDYPPHLHFQVIKDIQNYKGDYPGVASQKELSFYKENCPDPNLLLRLY